MNPHGLPSSRRRSSIGRLRALAVICAVALVNASCSSDHEGSPTTTATSVQITTTTEHRDPSLCPDAAWMAVGLTPVERAESLVAALDREQKVQQLHGSMTPDDFRIVTGIEDLCIPDLTVTNGPAGVGASSEALGGAPATALPAPIALAATWDPELATSFGDVIGQEMTWSGRNLMESPDVDIARVPLNGRTFESFGEDPLLQARIGVAQIEAVQDHGIIAMVKHFAVNNQETDRTNIDVRVDQRTLHQIYLPPFEAAVRDADVASVMCSYNKVNGLHACENPDLLQGILRDEWGFDGFVQSDFFATHSTVDSAEAGLDLEMPNGNHFGPPMQAALEAGQVDEAKVDEMLVRRYTQMFRLGLFDRVETVTPIAPDVHADVARRIAEAGTVLVRNQGDLLPLDPDGRTTIALVGPFSDTAVTGGGGSSIVNPLRTVTPLEGLTARIGDDVDLVTDSTNDPVAAAAAARGADVAIVVVGQVDSEGGDRTDLSLPDGQDDLIAAVAEANPNTVVVVHAGAPVTMPWLESVRSVLVGWYPGQEDGAATASVIFGDAEPGGRLPITFPRSVDDLPTSYPEQFPGVDGTQTYTEKLEVGYRHYLANRIEPLFPFGFGLSYTTFEMDDLRVPQPTDALDVDVGVQVTNTGRRTGSTVVQAYLTYPAAVGEPSRQLRGFQRVELAPGESETVTMKLDRRSFAYWSVEESSWAVTPGEYQIQVGSSSVDLPLEAEIEVPSQPD